MMKGTIMKIYIFLLLSTSFLFAENTSSYHSIDIEKNCKVTEVYEANMGGSLSCGNYHGMKVSIADDDLRMNLYLTRNKKEHNLGIWNLFHGFTELGKVIEFRHPKGKPDKPYAMIFRLHVQEYRNDKSVNVSYLIVAKMTPERICVVGKIKPQKNQNLLTRKMADKARSIPCLFEL